MEIKNLLRQHILNLQPYSSAKLEYTEKNAIFLDANENSLGSVTNTLHNRYPDPLQQAVKEKLAENENILPKNIFLGNGSDECIDLLIRIFCEPKEDKIMLFQPTFGMYETCANIHNVEIENVLLDENFQIDISTTLEKIDTDVKIIFICSPNNPTGNLIHKEAIYEILNQSNCIVVVDEAYHDFTDTISWTSELKNYKNLVVIKTFSKAFGLADARLGMLYANEEIVHYLNVIKPPYNINNYTQNLALEALENTSKKNAMVDELIQQRIFLEAELLKFNFIHKIYPSDANYILIKTNDANKLYNYLKTNKIIVRNRNNAPMCEGCVRISVGTVAENKKLLLALEDYT